MITSNLWIYKRELICKNRKLFLKYMNQINWYSHKKQVYEHLTFEMSCWINPAAVWFTETKDEFVEKIKTKMQLLFLQMGHRQDVRATDVRKRVWRVISLSESTQIETDKLDWMIGQLVWRIAPNEGEKTKTKS